MAKASQIDNVSEVHFGDCTPAPSAIAHDPNKEEQYQKMYWNLENGNLRSFAVCPNL